MRSLADFLNHGTLPFTGRERELSALLELWRGTLDSDGMRSLLLVGEAGIGKSRLIQEAIGRIEGEGGATVHMKFYPESTVSVAPPLAGALWRSNAGRQLLRQEPEETMASVGDALRRFAHLRPTILIIEDIHLLAGAALREFGLLLEGMSDEPLALLCAARPVELPARGLLERWPLEELQLEGLNREEMAQVWRKLFGGDPPGEIEEALAGATLGNALAVRSALLGAIKQEALVQGSDGRWGAESSFDYVVERSARSMTEGMTAHLSREETRAAGYVASLGEVFSREGAEQLIERPLLESLIFNGVVHELSLPKPPLPGLPKSRYPLLAFTHSLVHHQLADKVTASPAQLIGIVAAGVPLYSVLPFRLIADAGEMLVAAEPPAGTIIGGIDRALNVAGELDMTADWTLAATVWNAADLLIESFHGGWAPEELRHLRARSMARRLQLLRRSLKSDEFNSALARLLELTGEPLPGEMAIYRVVALTNRYWQLSSADRMLHAGLLDEIMELAERFPTLRCDRVFIKGLRDFCQIAQDDGYVEIRRRIEGEYEALMAAPDTPDEIRRYALGQIAPYFLTLLESPEELARRLEMYRDMLELPEGEQFVFVTNQPYFLEEIGQLDEAIAVIEKTLPQLKARGMMRTHSNRVRQLLRARALVNGDLDEYVAGLRRMSEDALREGIGVPPFLGNEIAFVGMLFGATGWWQGMLDEFPFEPEYLPPAVRVMAPGPLQPPPAEGEIIEMLKEPIVRTEQLLVLRAAEAHIRAGSGAFEPELMSNAIKGGLDWMSERRLDALMASFIGPFQDYLPPKQRDGYRKRAAQIAAEREAAEGARRGDGRLMVTMLGKIEVQVAGSDAEPLQPRGARQKSFLGAMVACEMLAKPLERDEFLEAAGIENDDPKLARDAVNSALYRLREVIGRDAIRMAGEIPRLNLDMVRVDLIDAHNLFREAAGAVRQGSLARAGLSTLKALDITRGDVPFPALYEGLFEAMREDFENLSRTTIIDVARRLLRESDAASAAQLLERAFAIMPDDEEIATLYPEALEAAGNHVEAERVRRKAEAAV